MKKVIISESYNKKVELVKKYLDGNFMRASMEKTGDNGLKKSIGIFVQLDSKHLPSDTTLYKQDVIDILDNDPNVNGIITDKDTRLKFFDQVVRDWFDNKITKNGSLSNYDF